MNFVIDDVLDGGVNDSLNLDSHGKALSFLLLSLPLRVPAALEPLLAGGDTAGLEQPPHPPGPNPRSRRRA